MGEISGGAISGAPEAAGPEASAIVERGSQRYKETKFFGDRDNGIGTTYFAPPKGEAKFQFFGLWGHTTMNQCAVNVTSVFPSRQWR